MKNLIALLILIFLYSLVFITFKLELPELTAIFLLLSLLTFDIFTTTVKQILKK